MKKWLVWWCLAALAGVVWAQDEEPLAVDEAFIPPKVSVQGQTLRAEWDITKGYFLYREKFKFESKSPGVTLGAPQFPKGKVKQDEFFGKVETYRKHVAVTVPYTASATALKLKLTYQGCADIGLCYPPQTREFDLKVAVSAAAPAAPSVPVAKPALVSSPAPAGNSLLSTLGKNLGLNVGPRDGEPMDVDQAFMLEITARDATTVVAKWLIADGVYLYRDKLKFSTATPGASLGQPQFPAGKMKEDAAFGKQEVYVHEVAVAIPVGGAASAIAITANYQGCAEIGFCYAPQTRTVNVNLPAGGAAAAAGAGATPGAPLSEQDQIIAQLASGNIFLIILSFFGFGLLLSFTPCVFPMIPILSSIIVGQGAQVTTRRAFMMSLVYVLAMAFTYTGAGVLAGLFGSNLQAAFQNPWILSSFAAVFVLLSLSMFGFYDLQMPGAIQSRLTEFSNRQQGGTLIGVGIMGFLSALIVGPCVAAPLAGALIFIGQTGNAVLGGVALFALSLGMGAPLLAIGVSAGKFLPKAGGWMDTVKAVFGVVMLGVAIWMVSRIIPGAVTLALWGVLLVVSAIYMGALEPLLPEVNGWKRLWKGLGVAALLYGALLLIGAAGNSQDMLQPLRGMHMSGATVAEGTGVARDGNEKLLKRISTLAEFDRELQAATAAGKPLMLDFYADWCVSCKEIEKFTFGDATVQKALSKGVLIQADITANDDNAKALQKRFSVVGPPSLIFFGPDGKERPQYRVVGFMPAKDFAPHVERAFAP
ncbi:MAG: protein-disulfide reductase DsbD [Pseudomonadota bacterium]